jgi:Zn-dependent protease/CBS domain-containing protein
MGRGFRIGKLFGIQVRVDWSWLVIFLLATWNLSFAFGQLHPDWGIFLRWGIAIVTVLLFFLSVLAHEFAHSLVAKANGIPVRSITLHLFGGVSNIEREPPSPGAEFVMAILGPVTSFVIGGVLLLIFSLTANVPFLTGAPEQVLSQLGPGQTMLLWLGTINIILGVFNLIPGFPLDGGRVLRSILWAISNNLQRATRWASWIGQGIAWLMIFGGISMAFGVQIPFLGTGLANGIWLAFIGWFLHNAAVQSYQQLIIRDVLEEVSVGELMRTAPPRVSPNATISSLVHEHVMRSDDHAFPVMTNGQLEGMVTLDDVRTAPREAWDTMRVQDIMTPFDALVTITPEENSREALDRLSRRDIRQLPVVQGDTLVGLLRRRDIVKWLQLRSDVGEIAAQ